jgi:hypothetical protein
MYLLSIRSTVFEKSGTAVFHRRNRIRVQVCVPVMFRLSKFLIEEGENTNSYFLHIYNIVLYLFMWVYIDSNFENKSWPVSKYIYKRINGNFFYNNSKIKSLNIFCLYSVHVLDILPQIIWTLRFLVAEVVSGRFLF